MWISRRTQGEENEVSDFDLGLYFLVLGAAALAELCLTAAIAIWIAFHD